MCLKMRTERYRPVKLLGSILLPIMLAGCAANPVTGEQDLVLMSEDQELSIGRKTHAEILEEYGEYRNDVLAKYVQRIGEHIASKSHRPNIIYRFTVLDSPQVNAFALPGGYIYVTRGILAYLNSEDELAAVLGHEIGHVTARHAVKRHTTSTLTGIAGAILAAQSGVQGAGDVANVLGTALVRGYGREHELEADRLGAEYLAKAGYNPEAMLKVIRVLKNQEEFEGELARLEGRQPRRYHGLFSTHPDNDKRLQSIIESSQVYRKGGWRPDDRNSYLASIDGMTFGSNARQGIIRGNRFYHHDLDFTLQFPSGWRIKNRPDRVVASPASNDGLIALTVRDRNRRISPRQFIHKRLGLRNLQSGEAFTHQGQQGYTGIALTDTDYGRRMARITVLYHGDKAYVIAGVARNKSKPYLYDKQFLHAARSFRALDTDEKGLAVARRLDIKQYTGQSYADLAKHSGLNHLAESQIRLINGHYPSGKPEHGEHFKTVK